MFSYKLTGSLHVKTFTQKKKNYSTYKQQSKQFQFIVVNTLFPAPSIPSVNHTSCVEFYHQSIKKIELIPSPRGHYLATIPLTKSQNNPRLEIEARLRKRGTWGTGLLVLVFEAVILKAVRAQTRNIERATKRYV